MQRGNKYDEGKIPPSFHTSLTLYKSRRQSYNSTSPRHNLLAYNVLDDVESSSATLHKRAVSALNSASALVLLPGGLFSTSASRARVYPFFTLFSNHTVTPTQIAVNESVAVTERQGRFQSRLPYDPGEFVIDFAPYLSVAKRGGPSGRVVRIENENLVIAMRPSTAFQAVLGRSKNVKAPWSYFFSGTR